MLFPKNISLTPPQLTTKTGLWCQHCATSTRLAYNLLISESIPASGTTWNPAKILGGGEGDKKKKKKTAGFQQKSDGTEFGSGERQLPNPSEKREEGKQDLSYKTYDFAHSGKNPVFIL